MNLSYPVAVILIFSMLSGCSQDSQTSDADRQIESTLRPVSHTPLDVVNHRMDAYNRHDLHAFMAAYAEDVEIFTYPVESVGKGQEHIRGIFKPMFEKGVVHVEIHDQIVKDSYVVNHETVDYGDEITEYVSIYEVRDGLIQSVRFVRD